MKLKDLTNLRFSMLTVQKRVTSSRNGHTRWRCVCDCGREVDVLSTHLIQGKTKSCGCLSRVVGPGHFNWNGYNNISGHHYGLLKHAASGKTRKSIEFNVTI